jgi:uncharacterized protein (DUF305 family)
MASTPFPEATRWRQLAGLALVAGVLGTGLVTADRLTRPGTAAAQGGMVMAADTDTATANATPGPVSIGFAQEMSQHHEQALLLARFAEVHGSPVVQARARDVAHTQLREIGVMQGWLMLWNAPEASDAELMSWMTRAYAQSGQRNDDYERFISLCSSLGTMPGQVSTQEFNHLAGLRGKAFDNQFLRLMIRHHESALLMAQFAHDHAEHELVRQLAATLIATQREEWLWMSRMLGPSDAGA